MEWILSPQNGGSVVDAGTIGLPPASGTGMDLANAGGQAVKRCATESSCDASRPKRMCLESAISFLDQTSEMSDDAVAKIDWIVAETLDEWHEGDDVIAEIDRIIEDMLAGHPGARFESSTVGNSTALQRYSVGLDMGDSVGANVNKGIQMIFPEEEGLFVDARCLVWAYDILSHGWWHLVPFQVKKPVSVFGLARKAVEWEEARKANPALRANAILGIWCYRIPHNIVPSWNAVMLSDWLRERRSVNDVGFGSQAQDKKHRGWFIPLSQVNAALLDLLTSWPVDPNCSYWITENIQRWWNRYRKQINNNSQRVPTVTLLQFEKLVLKMLGDLQLPLERVPKELRRAQRRQRIRERATGLEMRNPRDASFIQVIMSDLPPQHLVNISGDKFQIVTDGETDLRIPPRYLVWAYDILNHDWCGVVLEAILSPGLSVFQLAQKAWEWESNGGSLYTLSSSCYTCGEDGRKHPATESCERCEEPWNPEEFWEWLRSRHFENIYDQNNYDQNNYDRVEESRKVAIRFSSQSVGKLHRDGLSKIIDEIGFDIPAGREDSRFQMCDVSVEKFMPTFGFTSLSGRFASWWMAPCSTVFKKSSDGFCRWEHERLMVPRVSSTKLVAPITVCPMVCDTTEVQSRCEVVNGSSEINTCVGINESIPAFDITFPQEKEFRIAARYLVWAFDILHRGWWHLVPFEVTKPISVFGLARMAVEWDIRTKDNPTLKTNGTLEAGCYRAFAYDHDWDVLRFSDWVKWTRNPDDVATGDLSRDKNRQRAVYIPSNIVKTELYDLMDRWPVTELESTRFADTLSRWRGRYDYRMKGGVRDSSPRSACISFRQFEALVVRTLGDLRVPLTKVSREFRKSQRRQRISERLVALKGSLTGTDPGYASFITNDSPPPHLLDISGNKFRVVTDAEAELRVEPRYLVWAYDTLRHGRRGAIPEPLLSLGLSVFGLAQKASEWEADNERIYILSGSCYNCGERCKLHSQKESCERCEGPWNPEEFWEWLRSRHFEHLCDQLQNADQMGDFTQSTHSSYKVGGVYDVIEDIGFDLPPANDEPKIKLNDRDFNRFTTQKHPLSFETKKIHRSLASRFRQWLRLSKAGEFSHEGIDRWQLERLVVHKLRSLH
ncbi:hypothetical protein GNI_087930 [Gregarina niphandrodes]|uniref:Uncharacterized protein n=1 Tax=Gregarina niphandrodes TaxID=110365 RepID=A0A023B5R2_GRENI|nr:hypothetical protein GNI_087930 [Gregarina niphandrodes]EZG62557.1 hypothetical protein GNI_087930 [Gregarina niphandrodes]|eukprot:XP_011130726.1 hypothetical protein GNI_087930 [Gregarina niphandrodes]